MLKISKKFLLDKIRAVDIPNKGSRKVLIDDAENKNGVKAAAFLIKRGALAFPKKQIESEIDQMAESSLITIEQSDQMKNLLNNSKTGRQRVSNFLKKKKRIVVVNKNKNKKK